MAAALANIRSSGNQDPGSALGSLAQSLQEALRDISAVIAGFEGLKLERLSGPVDINGNDIEGATEYFSAEGMRWANNVDQWLATEVRGKGC